MACKGKKKKLQLGGNIPQKNLGGWLGDNAVPLAQTIGGAALTFGSAGALAPMGAGLMASGATGLIGNATTPDMPQMQSSQPQQPINQVSYAPTFENGGNMNIQEYGGNTHQQGGIGVDKQGNPSSISKLPTIAEVEDKEYAMDGYVFSQKLKPDKKSKSFAEQFKSTAKKYGYDFKSKGFIRPNDKMAQEEFREAIGQLKAKQDTTKVKKGLAHVMPDGTIMEGKPEMAMGGDLPKFYTGGTFNSTLDGLEPGMRTKDNYFLPQGDNINLTPNNIDYGNTITGTNLYNTLSQEIPGNIQSPTSNFGDIFNTTQVQAPNTSIQKPLLGTNNYEVDNTIPNPNPTTDFSNIFNNKQTQPPNTSIQKQQLNFGDVMPNEYTPRNLKGVNEPSYTPDSTTTTTVIPQGNTLANIGMGIQAGASALNAIRAFREKPQMTTPQQIAPQEIDLSQQRLAAKNEADLARSVAARNAGISGTTSGFLGNTRAANAGIQRGLGEQLGQSYMAEEAANAQARGQADVFNAQSRAQADQANIAERDAITNLRGAAISGLGTTAGSIGRDLLGYRAENEKLNYMGNPNNITIQGVGLVPKSNYTGEGGVPLYHKDGNFYTAGSNQPYTGPTEKIENYTPSFETPSTNKSTVNNLDPLDFNPNATKGFKLSPSSEIFNKPSQSGGIYNSTDKSWRIGEDWVGPQNFKSYDEERGLKWTPQKLTEHISSVNKSKYFTDEELAAQFYHESGGGYPHAVSPTGVRGMAQFTQSTGKQYGLNKPEDFFNPEKSLAAGIKYMDNLYKTFRDKKIAQVAYNRGPGAVGKALKAAAAVNNIEIKDVKFKDILPYLDNEGQNYVSSIDSVSTNYFTTKS